MKKDTANQPKWQDKNIVEPHENDILLGRGGASIHNDANVRYRTMVREHKKAYQTYTRLQKTQLAESLVKEWQTQNPPGRFLEQDAATSTWYCISEKSARRKTSQLLREGAPKIRRQLKEEAVQQKAAGAQTTTMTPPPSMVRTPSPVVAAAQPPTTIRTTTPPRGGPPRTSASKQAKAKLKAKGKDVSPPTPAPVPVVHPAVSSPVLNNNTTTTPASTPSRNSNYVAPTTRPPLMPQGTGAPGTAVPRMATPSPQMFVVTPPPAINRENWPMPGQPPRWQWPPPYYGAAPSPYHYPYYSTTPAPAPVGPVPASVPPATPTPTSTTPLKPITPADTNQRNIPYTNANAPTKPTKPVVPTTTAASPKKTTTTIPATPKPKPMEERVHSLTKPPFVERKPSAPSPESVLDFEELCSDLPIHSWDCSMTGGDVDGDGDDDAVSLGGEKEMPEPAVLQGAAIVDDEALHLPHLSPPRRNTSSGSLDDSTMMTIKPASLSPPKLRFRGDDSHPSNLDTLQAFSFDSFDRMESLVQAESSDSSTIEILNELDREMEADLLLRPCHSF